MKRVTSWLLVSFFLLTNCSCKKEEEIVIDSQGVTVKQPVLWVSPLSKDGIMSYNFRGGSVFYKNTILTMGAEAGLKGGISIPGEGNDYLAIKNLEDGKDFWKWDDQWTTAESGDIKFPLQYDQYLTYTNGPRIYGIDLATGQTLWKKQDMNQYSLSLLGLGISYFVAADSKETAQKGSIETGIYEGDIRTGKQNLVVVPNYSHNYRTEYLGKNFIGGANWAMPFIYSSDTLLLITYQELSPPGPPYIYTDKAHPFMCLYNKTQKKWIYEHVELAEAAVSQVVDGIPILLDGLVYLSVNRTITCHEVLTGKLIWKQSFGGNFTGSGFILVDNKLICYSEDGYLTCLNARTLQQLWQQKISCFARLQALNGIVYFVGGGTLNAVDSDTGKVYWKIVSPDYKNNSSAFFYNMCSVAPGINGQKGKVIVSSGLNAFCYEAVR